MNQHTQIPNEVLEKLATCELSAADFRVLMVIIRKTYGWHKDTDAISYTQFEEATGLGRKAVHKSLKRLKAANMILVSKRRLVSYKVNPDLDSWVVSKRILVSICTPTSYQMDTSAVSKRIPKVVSKWRPTKEKKKTNTKETNTKEKVAILEEVDLELRDIQKHYNFVFEKNTTSTAGFRDNYTKHWRAIHDVEKIKLAIDNARLDSWWSGKLTLAMLFRLKNPRGEAVDYIEDLAGRIPERKRGNIAIL